MPPYIDPLNLQLAAGLRGDFAEGWRLAQLLERERPEDDRAAFNRGWYYLMRGDLQKGMELMDRGRRIAVFGSEMLPPQAPPQWDGVADLHGKTLLLRSEGGFGDEIIHVRFAKDFAARGATVVVSCNPGLASLFARVPGVAAVVPHAAINTIPFDYWVPAMSAARWLGHTYQTLPGGSYLAADPVYIDKWRLCMQGPGKKVGIRWSGNPKFEHEQHRRFPPEPLLALASVPGVTLFSLQRDADLRDLPPGIVDLQTELETWEDTAAAMHHLDLVITSCTATAHLAAALGKETWVIVPVLPYYLWALPGTKTPWYNTVTIFRQEQFGQWDATLVRVQDEFKKWAFTPGVPTAPATPTGFGAPVQAPTPVAQAQPQPQAGLYIPGMYFAPKPVPRTTPRAGAKTMHFVAGLPRTGATVLMSLLAQNPRMYSAPISGLCGIFSGVYANWEKNERHHEMPNEDAKRRVLLSLLESYHDTDRPVLLDKERMWVAHCARLEALLGRPIKIIVQVRPLPEILASFEMLRRRDPLVLTAVDEALGGASTAITRANYFAGDGGVLGIAYNALRDAVSSGYLDRMLFVDYNKLVAAPKMQLKRIYEFLEEPYFEHDINNIAQVAHGKLEGFPGLHDIRPELKRTSPSARDILGPEVYAQYDKPEPWAQWT